VANTYQIKRSRKVAKELVVIAGEGMQGRHTRREGEGGSCRGFRDGKCPEGVISV